MTNNRSQVDIISGLLCAVSLIMVLLCLSGCRGEPTAAAVDPALARQTLEEVLKSWQNGESTSHWKTHAPPVVVQDPDWQSGRQLVAFELRGEARALDANLHCPVLLTLKEGPSAESNKEVAYIVGTDPVLTVFRNPFDSP